MWRLFVVCLSLANLCYVRVWQQLLAIQPRDLFWESHPPFRFQYIAAIADVLILGTVFFIVAVALRRAPVWLRSIWFIALVLLCANAVRGIVFSSFSTLRVPWPTSVRLFVLLMVAVGFGVTCWMVFRFNASVGRAGAFVATLFVPFVLYAFGDSVWKAIRYNQEGTANGHTASRFQQNPKRRVVWVIFDEMDYRLSFVSRPGKNRMPNFDWLRAQSLTASNAKAPAMFTTVSMPSLIYGREIKSADALSAGRMRLSFLDGSAMDFGDRPNVFSTARSMGMNTAVIGWYLPYCRTLNESLTDCWWNPQQSQENSVGNKFSEALILQSRSIFETHYFSMFGQSLATQGHAAMYTALLDHAKKAAVDPSLGLVLLHFNIPHLPVFYDQRTGRFDRSDASGGYDDALVLTDRALGELRSEMENQGMWSRTTVLVSADHFYRDSPMVNGQRDHRVPFMVHYPGDDNRVDFGSELQTVLTSDLILATLGGEVKSNAEAAGFLRKDMEQNFSARARDAKVNAGNLGGRN